MTSKPQAIIVGSSGWTHIGSAFEEAAADFGAAACLCDVAIAASRSRAINAIAWRLRARRPPFPGRLRSAVRLAVAHASEPVLISTGLAPLGPMDVRHAGDAGAICLHFSSDDPWNPSHRARWHHRALPEYDVVFTPRRSNISDFRALGCRDVRYLPFAFDPHLFPACNGRPSEDRQTQALFVGGADADRAAFFRDFVAAGAEVGLVGGYWDRYPDLKPRWLGHRPPGDLLMLTQTALVNLILVRRANRDGHVMRSFEAGAIGGCLLVEDTDEHRDIFGTDGETVRYFRTPAEAAAQCRALATDPAERARLAAAVKARIRGGAHTYADRLATMLAAAEDIRRARVIRSTPAGIIHGRGPCFSVARVCAPPLRKLNVPATRSQREQSMVPGMNMIERR